MFPCRRISLGIVLASLIACPLGCGPATGKVSGTVSFEDQPLRLGTVNLMGEDGRPYQGQIGDDGKYAIEGVPWGKYRVMIHSPNPTPPSAAPPRKKLPPELELKAKEKKWIAIPEKYDDFDTSELSVDVNKSVVAHDIPLKP